MKILNALILISFYTVTTGCAPKKPLSYNPDNSKAFNIVKAAGMDYGLKDVKTPKDTVSDIRDSKSFGAAYGLASYYSPTPGMPSSGSAGMAILSWALLPKTPAARNSIIAWMPEDIGGKNEEEAFDKMADIIIEATEKAAKELKYKTSVYIPKNGTDKSGLVINLVDNKSAKCAVAHPDPKSYCNMVYKVRRPHRIENTAHYVGKGATWFFDPMERKYTAPIFIDKWGFQYNQLDMVIAVSKYLPEWAYIYLAPKEVRITENDDLKMPLILNKGKVHLFIKAKNS